MRSGEFMSVTIGIDLCDDYTTICVEGSEDVSVIPTVICRDKHKEKWHIGEEALREALSGKAVPTDKLIKLLRKEGRSTISGRTYSAVELCGQFIKKLLEQELSGASVSDIDMLTLCVESPDKMLLDHIREALLSIGLREQSLRLIGHAEAFIHYILNKDKDLYANTVALFDLNEGDLSYHEFRMIRGLSRLTALCEGTMLEEAFRIDILNSEAGRKLADHILTECARKLMDKKIISSVFLTGKGFEDMDFAEEFKEYVCRRRRVMYDEGIFARGALQLSDKLCKGSEDEVLMLCDSRLPAEISMPVTVEGRPNRLILAPAGTSWYGYTAHAEFIPQGQDHADIEIKRADAPGTGITRTVDISGMPGRPDRCTRIGMDMELLGPGSLRLRFTDLGFGDFFPAGGREIVSEIEF